MVTLARIESFATARVVGFRTKSLALIADAVGSFLSIPLLDLTLVLGTVPLFECTSSVTALSSGTHVFGLSRISWHSEFFSSRR